MNLLNPTDAFFVISFINWTWITDAPIAMQDRTFVWGITLMELNEPVPVVKFSVTLSDPAVKTCNPPLIDAYRSQKPVGA
jgi:hypothetical protein